MILYLLYNVNTDKRQQTTLTCNIMAMTVLPVRCVSKRKGIKINYLKKMLKI